jgi:protein-tyrosine phosphatase
MDIFQIDAEGCLFISPDVDDWAVVAAHRIDVVFDLDGDLDLAVPCIPNQMIYVHFPIDDDPVLPDLTKLHALAQLGASLVGSGQRVLAHCGMGHNRSALIAGLILVYLGMSGDQAVGLLREKRQGALYNRTFASYLLDCKI